MNNGKIGPIKFFTWSFRGMSVAIQAVLISYITFYCTDVLGLRAAAVAMILMATKLFDGVTDLFAGFIVDRTKTKLGKARPYELAIIALWICTWAMFTVPVSLSTTVKYVWVAVAYTLAQSICNTLLNANGTVYMVRAFNSQEAYVKINSLGGLVTVVGVAVFNLVFPSMIENAGTDANEWSHMVMMLAIPLAIIGILRFIFVPEQYDVDAGADVVDFKEVVSLLKTNKYIYFVAGITLISQLVGSLGVAVYYFTYIVGNKSLMGIMSLFTVVAMTTMVFYPMILKKISLKKMLQLACFVYAIGGAILFVAGSNTLLLGIGNIVLGIGSLPISMMSGLLIIECADYNEWKGRPRMEGTLGSVNGFAGKIGQAAGTFVCGILLGIAGYVGGSETIVSSAMTMIKLLYSIIPAALFLLIFVILIKYDLDKNIEQIRSDNEARRQGAATEQE